MYELARSQIVTLLNLGQFPGMNVMTPLYERVHDVDDALAVLGLGPLVARAQQRGRQHDGDVALRHLGEGTLNIRRPQFLSHFLNPFV